MILAALFAVPFWLALPGYFIIGVLWALLYLPRAVGNQARRYSRWKHKLLEGKTLEQAFTTPTRYSTYHLSPNQFLTNRGSEDFSERKILKGFLLDIAFWPLRIIQAFLLDIVCVVLDKLVEYFADFFRLVIARLVRWAWRGLRYFWRNVVVPVARAIRRFFSYLWKQVIKVYQAIIQRANREAIADMEVLNRTTEEGK
jgi:hypothetical protein